MSNPIDRNGTVNKSLSGWGGLLTKDCREKSRLDNANVYTRKRLNNGWYDNYFEANRTGDRSSSHRHDWENVVVFVRNDTIRRVDGGEEYNPNPKKISIKKDEDKEKDQEVKSLKGDDTEEDKGEEKGKEKKEEDDFEKRINIKKEKENDKDKVKGEETEEEKEKDKDK
ncbi:hypothetical protein FPRO06_10067 [Fusarium proliferatum]|nr:hypothetical protein FPRO06_10067 [Fusarium proliferatum]